MNLQKFIAAPMTLVLALGSVPLLTLNSPAYAKTVDVPVPKAAVAIAFNTALSSTRIHVDNYGKKQGTSWLQNSSYILLPNGIKKGFPIPEYTYKITKRRKWKYYVNDMNTSSIQATINGSSILATARFENQGEELKGKCLKRRFRRWKQCGLKRIERDIHLNNAMLSVLMRPVSYQGSISYAKDLKVDFKTDVRISNKLCRVFKRVCGWIQGKIKRRLTNTIETQFARNLQNERVRARVATSIKNSLGNRLGKYKNWKIIGISSRGSNFILRLSN